MTSLIDALDQARRSEPPRDPKRASVADLYGCDRATWFRRNGYEMPPHSAASLRKFDVGHAVEAQHIARLRSLGYKIWDGLRVALRVDEDDVAVGQIVAKDAFIAHDEIEGHPDIFIVAEPGGGIVRQLVEVKTTDVRKADGDCKPHYELQAAAYAIALDAHSALVHVTHVVPYEKPEAEYVVDFDALRDRVAERITDVLLFTAPGRPMPAAEPPAESAAWACKYCPIAQCERNANKDAVLVERPF